MASLLTSTMDLSFGGYDCPLLGDLVSDPMILTDSVATFGDALTTELDLSCVNNFATGGLAPEDVLKSISAEKMDYCFENLLTCDREEVKDQLIDGSGFELPACSPATSEPAPDVQILADPNEWITQTEVTTLADFTFASCKDITSLQGSAPGSPDSGFASSESPSPSVSSQSASPSPSPVDPSLVQVSAEDLQYLQALWSNDIPQTCDSPQIGAQAVLTAVVLDPIIETNLPVSSTPVKKSRKSPSSKSTKTLSASEKKERKRAQNKNAATRYREKKRAEARVVYEEQTQMEDKNRQLKEKLTLLTHEIQTMKDLLKEVFRSKGLIK